MDRVAGASRTGMDGHGGQNVMGAAMPRASGWQIGAALLLNLAAAGLASAAEPPPGDRALHQAAGALFASAYRQIEEFYLDPVSLETLAVAGIAGLDAADHSFMVGETQHKVTILEDDRETLRMPAPSADDAEGWAEVTATAIVAARGHSHELTQATDEELYQRVFDGITAKLDRFTRYAGRDQAREQRAQRDGFGGIGVTLDYSEPTPGSAPSCPTAPRPGRGSGSTTGSSRSTTSRSPGSTRTRSSATCAVR